MPSSVTVTTGDREKDYSAFRFGQGATYENFRFIADRDPYGRKLVRRFVDDAIGAGFELLKEDGDPLEQSDDIWKVFKKQWNRFKQSKEIKRTFGQAVTTIFKSENPLTKGEPFFKVFEPKNIDDTNLEYFNDTSLKKILLWEEQFQTGAIINHKLEGSKLLNVWMEIQESKEKFWQGRSYLEPVWDEIQGLRAIRMGATIFAIRVGAGLRIITVPKGTHPDTIAEMKTAARNLESFNGYFVIPEEGAKVNIETASGMIDYGALKMVLLESLAAYTGYPIAGFTGIEMERQGGDFNDQKILDCYRDIQRDAEEMLRWAITRFDEFHDWGVNDETDYIIKWKVREEISDSEQVNLDQLRATKDATDINAGIRSVQEIRDERGYKGPIPERPNAFGVGVSFKDEDKDKPEEKEEQEDEDVEE